MACRRCLKSLTRHSSSLFPSNPQSLHPLKTLTSNLHTLQRIPHIFHNPSLNPQPQSLSSRTFSSPPKKNPKFVENVDDEDEHENEEDDETSDEDWDDENEERENGCGPVGGNVSRAYSLEEKIEEAANIGYKVIGPLQPDDRVFKPYEPVFAVVQIGSHQFKVSNGDSIYVEKLKFCEVNDKLILNKVMMMGSPTQTIIGRPILPEAAVHAVVEEHALDAKVIIFKKKRRKNYRRTKGHRQELTRLRITDIQGIEKPETPSAGKTTKTSSSKQSEKVAVAA